jgi:hypothetical protein
MQRFAVAPIVYQRSATVAAFWAVIGHEVAANNRGQPRHSIGKALFIRGTRPTSYILFSFSHPASLNAREHIPLV